VPRLGADTICPRRDHRLHLRPEARYRACLPRGDFAAAADRVSAMGGQAGAGPHHRHRCAGRHQRHRPDPRRGDQLRRQRTTDHLRARPQPAVSHLRGGAWLPARHPAARRRHVRDGLLRLSGLPQRDVALVGGNAAAGDRGALPTGVAADVALEGRHLGARGGAWRLSPHRSHPGAQPHLLPRRPHPPPRLGLWLRPMPRLQTPRRRLG